MEKRPGESVTRVCAQVRSLGQAKPYEIADTAIIMQIHVIYRGGGATGGALNRIIFMIIIAFNHQTGGRPRVFLARVINCDKSANINLRSTTIMRRAQQRKRSPLLVLPAARPLAELQVFSRVRGPRTRASDAGRRRNGEESERRSRKVLKVSPWVSPISRKQISPRQPGPRAASSIFTSATRGTRT